MAGSGHAGGKDTLMAWVFIQRGVEMLNRKWVMGAIVASALGAIPAVASAAIYVDIAPPEARYEVVPAPRAGYVWAPGYYNYRNGRYVWTGGHWERERHWQYWPPGP